MLDSKHRQREIGGERWKEGDGERDVCEILRRKEREIEIERERCERVMNNREYSVKYSVQNTEYSVQNTAYIQI